MLLIIILIKSIKENNENSPAGALPRQESLRLKSLQVVAPIPAQE
jgi:hypothetical protein